jgi:hypothetical protein
LAGLEALIILASIVALYEEFGHLENQQPFSFKSQLLGMTE